MNLWFIYRYIHFFLQYVSKPFQPSSFNVSGKYMFRKMLSYYWYVDCVLSCVKRAKWHQRHETYLLKRLHKGCYMYILKPYNFTLEMMKFIAWQVCNQCRLQPCKKQVYTYHCCSGIPTYICIGKSTKVSTAALIHGSANAKRRNGHTTTTNLPIYVHWYPNMAM